MAMHLRIIDGNGGRPPMAAGHERTLASSGDRRLSGWLSPDPLCAHRGNGCWIERIDGMRLLDCANNAFALIHGHAFPPVLDAIHRVIASGAAFGLLTGEEVDLAELIQARMPACEQVRFCASGNEAVMFAVQGARVLTGRAAIAKFEGRDADVVALPWSDPDRAASILAAHGPQLAALVIDPMPSRAGMPSVSREMVEVIHAARARYGFKIIADETVTVRLAYAGAHRRVGLRPDMVVLGGIIGGGLPLGALAGSKAVMSAFDDDTGASSVYLDSASSANPLAVAAGFSALAHLDAKAIEDLDILGSDLRARVNLGFIERRIPAQLTGAGSLFRLHLSSRPITDVRSSAGTAPDALKAIVARASSLGLLMTPNCSGALSTPMGREEIETLCATLIKSVSDVFRSSPWTR